LYAEIATVNYNLNYLVEDVQTVEGKKGGIKMSERKLTKNNKIGLILMILSSCILSGSLLLIFRGNVIDYTDWIARWATISIPMWIIFGVGLYLLPKHDNIGYSFIGWGVILILIPIVYLFTSENFTFAIYD